MHVSVKSLAFSGVVTALAIVCIILGSVLEFNTAFLLVLAAFLTGTLAAVAGVPAAWCSFAATVILGFFLSPEKMYLLTFSFFVPYVINCEYISKKKVKKSTAIVIKALTWWIWSAVCACIFLVIAGIVGLNALIPEFLAEASMPLKLAAAILALVIAWIVTDVAYYAYRKEVNGRLYRIFNKEERS